MRVSEVLSFKDYWNDVRFKNKKPNLSGSLKQIHGDNIYYKHKDVWRQLDSHHSHPNGVINRKNLDTDIGGENVLVSDHFIYLGDVRYKVPEKYKSLCPNAKQRDYITIKDKVLAAEFVNSIKNEFTLGIHSDPVHWREYLQIRLF